MDHIYLTGSDSVERGGNAIRSAAEEMNRAAQNIEGALDRHQRFMDDWLERYQNMLVADAVNSGRA